jgi:hypothetical protein
LDSALHDKTTAIVRARDTYAFPGPCSWSGGRRRKKEEGFNRARDGDGGELRFVPCGPRALRLYVWSVVLSWDKRAVLLKVGIFFFFFNFPNLGPYPPTFRSGLWM